MSILITGGAGFIGSNLADKLINVGKEIVIIDNFDNYYDVELKKQNLSSVINSQNLKFYQGDICDENILERVFWENKIDSVIHLAACAGVRNSFLEPLKYLKTNILGTINILEEMKKHRIDKIIFTSSSSVYGNCDEDKFREDLTSLNPISPYAITKLAGEKIIFKYSNKYNINAICLRCFSVYGPKQRPDLAIRKFITLIEHNKPIPVYGNGTAIRDYTYIDDIILGICAALNYNKTKYEIINLGGNNPVTLNEMIKIIEKIVGKKALIERFPNQKGDVIKTISDNTKAETLLNFYPKISLEEGIKKFVEWEEYQ